MGAIKVTGEAWITVGFSNLQSDWKQARKKAKMLCHGRQRADVQWLKQIFNKNYTRRSQRRKCCRNSKPGRTQAVAFLSTVSLTRGTEWERTDSMI